MFFAKGGFLGIRQDAEIVQHECVCGSVYVVCGISLVRLALN